MVWPGSASVQSTFPGTRTSMPQGSPVRQPLSLSCLAAEASASGTECQMSALAVAVEIDRVFVELRGQELRQPHGAAPGRAQVGARHAVLQHLQRGEEFVAEEILALAGVGLRRQHADGVEPVMFAAVVGLARPDRQHDVARHAELFFDARERALVLRGELLALRGQALEGRLAQILPGRLHEFGLLRRLLGAAGDGEIGQRESGSRPRIAASKVVRETPSFCASGQVDWRNCWKAASPKAACR